MGRLLKIILFTTTSVVLLVIIAAVVLPLVIDPNDFKPEIQQAVEKNTGRKLNIEGDLELSVFPWIGVSTGKLTLSNAPGFTDKLFAEITESNIKVKLLPLLSKEVEVSRIVLKGLVLNLAKNKQGVSNWDDLSGSEKTKGQPEETDKTKKEQVSLLAALAIGGIAIEQAKIVWDDQQQGKYIELNDFNFQTGKLVFDQPVAIDLSLTIVNKEPEITESINFTADLVINEQLDIFKLKQINIESITSGKEIPGEKLTATLLAEMALDLTQQTLNVSEFKLSTGNLNLTANIVGTSIKDNPVFKGSINVAEFNLAQLLKTLAMPLPVMQDPDSLTKLSVAFDLMATTDSADIQNLVITLDETNINGSSSIKNFSQPEIVFNLNVDAINVDHYLSPVKEGKSSSKAVVTPASAAVAGAALFPVEMLRTLNTNGRLKIDKLTVNRLNMQGLSLKLNAKNGVIKTKQDIKQLYQGSYSGATTLNVQRKQPRLVLNESLSMVHIEPLLKDLQDAARMTGVVNADVKLQGQGNSVKAIKSSLNGKVDFNFKDGVVKGFNLQKMIENSKALLGGNPLPAENKNDQTVFSVIKGSADISNGLVSNNDLYAEASKLRVYGEGTANLVSEKLDYKVDAKLLRTIATATQPEKIEGVPVVVKVGGTFSKPTYTLDIAAMLMEKNKDKINKKKDELLEKLDEKLGPGVSDLLKSFF
jgi:AsmA protein